MFGVSSLGVGTHPNMPHTQAERGSYQLSFKIESGSGIVTCTSVSVRTPNPAPRSSAIWVGDRHLYQRLRPLVPRNPRGLHALRHLQTPRRAHGLQPTPTMKKKKKQQGRPTPTGREMTHGTRNNSAHCTISCDLIAHFRGVCPFILIPYVFQRSHATPADCMLFAICVLPGLRVQGSWFRVQDSGFRV